MLLWTTKLFRSLHSLFNGFSTSVFCRNCGNMKVLHKNTITILDDLSDRITSIYHAESFYFCNYYFYNKNDPINHGSCSSWTNVSKTVARIPRVRENLSGCFYCRYFFICVKSFLTFPRTMPTAVGGAEKRGEDRLLFLANNALTFRVNPVT